MTTDEEVLKKRYEEFALSGDEKTTAEDFQLRELEIGYGVEHIRDGDVVLDVGCGPGVALRTYAAKRKIEAHGIDYAANMVKFAETQTKKLAPDLDIKFQQASVTKLPFPNGKFDVITSHRCLMALLDWNLQQDALREIHRVLKPGGTLVLMEGTFDGLDRLNFFRRKFGLSEIEADGRARLITLKFHEKQLLDFCEPYYDLLRTQRCGMYNFLTRIVQPLLAYPDPPRYDHPLNAVAKNIAKFVPDFESIGHLVGFALRKRPA
jgi:ubiquinone/menaquinone biosynthesis C-methylase UbiE